MGKYKKISFKLPETIEHEEVYRIVTSLVKRLNAKEMLDPTDIPQLHRMATAYDMYLKCVDIIAREGMTMTNLKGETVKRPEANLLKESWGQYLELAREYGLTAKSKGQIKALSQGDEEESPIDRFVKDGKEIR